MTPVGLFSWEKLRKRDFSRQLSLRSMHETEIEHRGYRRLDVLDRTLVSLRVWWPALFRFILYLSFWTEGWQWPPLLERFQDFGKFRKFWPERQCKIDVRSPIATWTYRARHDTDCTLHRRTCICIRISRRNILFLPIKAYSAFRGYLPCGLLSENPSFHADQQANLHRDEVFGRSSVVPTPLNQKIQGNVIWWALKNPLYSLLCRISQDLFSPSKSCISNNHFKKKRSREKPLAGFSDRDWIITGFG